MSVASSCRRELFEVTPFAKPGVGSPPSSHPLPPHPHPLACCVKGPWFQGGRGGVLSSVTMPDLSREKSLRTCFATFH